MKYDEDLYLNCGFYDGDMDCDIRNWKKKIVKCRKPHECNACHRIIERGEQAMYESGFIDGEPPLSSYTCLKCIEDWIEEIGLDDESDYDENDELED